MHLLCLAHQLVHAVGMRDVNKSVFRMNHFSNHYMIFACMSGIVLQALVTEIPYFIKLFGTVRLSLKEWGMLAALSAMPLVVHELLVDVPHGMDEGRREWRRMKGRLRRFVRRRIGGNREHALELAVGPIPFAHKRGKGTL